MDEYAFEIHLVDPQNRDGWSCKDDNCKVEARDEHEANDKANALARQKFGVPNFRIRSLRLAKRAKNPDGEI